MKTLLILPLALLTAAPAFALDLSGARAQGKVCERPDGLIAANGPATPEVQELVASVNKARQAEYARISQQNGQPASVVASLAAQQLISQGNAACH